MVWVIVEIKDNDVLIMNTEGKYKKIKYQTGYEVGQEVELNNIKSIRFIRFAKRIMKISVLVSVLVVTGIYLYYLPFGIVKKKSEETVLPITKPITTERLILLEPIKETLVTQDKQNITVVGDVYSKN